MPLLDQVDDLFVLWKAAGLVFGIDQFAVEFHVEDAVAAFDQLRFFRERLLDAGRQTGGLGQVVSHHAILNADLHHNSPSWWSRPFSMEHSKRGAALNRNLRGHPGRLPCDLPTS